MTSPHEPDPATGGTEIIGRVELLMSGLLRGGVLLSLVLVLTGLVIMFVHHPSYLHSVEALQRLTSPGAAFPQTLAGVAEGVRTGHGQAVVIVGLLVLIATPVLRVAVSVVVFAIERDWVFVVVTALVLAVLLVSFALGAAG